MRIFNYIFVAIFLLFAALQYNDPDPYIWIPIYGYAALLCWWATKNKFYPSAYIIGISVYLLYAIYLVFTKDGVMDWAKEHHAESLVQTMKADKPWIEDTREFGGLLILIIVLGVNYFYFKRKAPSK